MSNILITEKKKYTEKKKRKEPTPILFRDNHSIPRWTSRSTRGPQPWQHTVITWEAF